MITEKNPAPHNDNSTMGFVFFFFYVAIYSFFVFLNAFYPEKMTTLTISGINLPVIYGFILITSAVFLALIYSLVLRNKGKHSGDSN
ncbi:MAG: DUF485 domain-containing protein [Planctomycetes bacterium]|nr:DUF485 domain-containing protein [Planctomycetota bacterium]